MLCPVTRTGRNNAKATRWGLRFGTGDAQRSGGGFGYFFVSTPRAGSSSLHGSTMKTPSDHRPAKVIRTPFFSACSNGAIRLMTGPHGWQRVEHSGRNVRPAVQAIVGYDALVAGAEQLEILGKRLVIVARQVLRDAQMPGVTAVNCGYPNLPKTSLRTGASPAMC
jgi:hypothetical protein